MGGKQDVCMCKGMNDQVEKINAVERGNSGKCVLVLVRWKGI